MLWQDRTGVLPFYFGKECEKLIILNYREFIFFAKL
jgi:hypothetical protein